MTRSWEMRISLSFFLLVLCIGGNARGQSTPVRRRDAQNWNDIQLAVPLTKRLDFLLLGHLRMGDNFRRPVDERIGAAFAFALVPQVTFSGSYLHIEMQPAGGVKSHEDRLSVGATLRVPFHGFTISDRNLFEHRFRRPQIDATRYRNRLQVEHPIGPKQAKLSLFVADEVFYDWSLKVWPRNRCSIGLSRKFNKHFTGELYYLRQNDSHSRPGDLHVIGTAMRFHL